MFNGVTKDPKSSRFCISFKIESSRSLGDLKHDNNAHIGNVIDTLKKKDAFLRREKFKSHKDYSLGFFVDTNPRVTLRDSIRPRTQDQLMWIDIDAEESK